MDQILGRRGFACAWREEFQATRKGAVPKTAPSYGRQKLLSSLFSYESTVPAARRKRNSRSQLSMRL